MNKTYLKTKLKILAWSEVDSIDLFFTSSIVEEFYHYENSGLIKTTTLNVIRKLLEEEVVKAGDLLKGNKFIVWNKKNNEIIDTIKQKWDNLDRKLQPHEIVWLEITEIGRKEFEYLNSLPELKETDPFYFNDK